MELVFGFDIGTTSIGFAAIEYDEAAEQGRILRMGTRIFPEARDVDGTPLNQTRRTKRMMRRQLRRRKERRAGLNGALASIGLLPIHKSSQWDALMATDPVDLRARALGEQLSLHEIGRALSHLAKRRHFRGKDLEENEDGTATDGETVEQSAAELAELGVRQKTVAQLDQSGATIGELLASRNKGERQRGIHALRRHVQREFDLIWTAQARHHPDVMTDAARTLMEQTIFAQKPVFWRTNTLGECALEGTPVDLAKGSWQSAQRRMLEKLNSLKIEGGNGRPLSDAERAIVLEKLQVQQTMSFSTIKSALEPLWKAEGLSKRSVTFNLENGGETKLPGNPVEAKLASIFGDSWTDHPHRQAIREAAYDRIGAADYGRIGNQRVVIRRQADRDAERATAAQSFARDFGATTEQVEALSAMTFPTGWDSFSKSAVEKLLVELERGAMMGALLASAEWAVWRQTTFPNRIAPTGEILDRLPSPKDKDEAARQKRLRNPTVVRAQNELRKVVNNLIDFCGRKPDRIRVELARDVGLGKAEREEKSKGMRQKEKVRAAARAELTRNGFAEPTGRDIEKWMLWKECGEQCPYTGDKISFAGLFHDGEFQVEHIWPRSRSLDDSQANKTLCRKDVNIAKGNKTPFEFFANRPDEWEDVKNRVWKMVAPKGKDGMSPGKVRRFLKAELPDDFATRQLNDTGYAARLAIQQLKRLWPDVGPEAPVMVQAVNGKVTAHLRRLWELNHLLGDTGEKNRADHRHHAVDALVVACAVPGITNRLSRYWQTKDDPRATDRHPHLPPPWEGIRHDAAKAVAEIVVSHRVRKKVSGPLHEETVYGDTGDDVTTSNGTYRLFTRRKPIESLSKGEVEDIRDEHVRQVVSDWIAERGGDPKKVAWKDYPRVNPGGSEIKKVRILIPKKQALMVPLTTAFGVAGSNHHLAIFQKDDGKFEYEVVSLFEASKRLSRRTDIVRREKTGAKFLFSLSQGDIVEVSSGERKGLWTPKSIAGNGQIFMRRITDASTDPKLLWGPSPGPLIKLGARKVSVDPIGRVRPAND